MNNTNEIGVPYRITATGTFTFGTGHLCLLGANCGSVATGPTVQLYHGGAVTASATLIGATTLAANAFTRIPAYVSGGCTVVLTDTTTIDLTIYWNPLG